MSFFWQSIAWVLIGFSVQFCGKSGGSSGPSNDSPPSNLPTASLADFQSAALPVDQAESKLAGYGFVFTSHDDHGKKDWDWDRAALLKMLARHPDRGLDPEIPHLQAYAASAKPFLDQYGHGYLQIDPNGNKIWIRAGADPIDSYSQKYQLVLTTISRIQADSVNDDGNDAVPDLDVRGTDAPPPPPRTPARESRRDRETLPYG